MALKGVKQSEEHKLKRRLANLGKKRNKPAWNKGKQWSEEIREKIRKGHIGLKHNEEWKKRQSISHIGIKRTKEYKKKYSGSGHWNWKGGISSDKAYCHRVERNRKLAIIGSHTQGEWDLLKKQYGYRCPCCGRSEPEIILTKDHIIPITKGGSDYIENIQPLCRSCNSKKHTKTIKY
jgi:5-methylcytosine-specific restriction endonuclease McrA